MSQELNRGGADFSLLPAHWPFRTLRCGTIFPRNRNYASHR
jgi:hypothetical protein